MRLLKPVTLTAVIAALAGCGAAASQQPSTRLATGGSCSALQDVDQQVAALYAGVRDVEPVHRTRFVARAIQPKYVAGARFTIPAERGMTAPYLERALSCHAAATADAGHPNDLLRVDGIEDVDVAARGPSFVVSVTSANRTSGAAIYERARALEQQRGAVQVEQIAAAARPSAL